MLFTWDTNNLCIVFKQWHIRSTPGLIISLIAVVLIAMGYEGLRAMSRTYEKSIASRVDTAPSESIFPSSTRAPLPFGAVIDALPCHRFVYFVRVTAVCQGRNVSELKLECVFFFLFVLWQGQVLRTHSHVPKHLPIPIITGPKLLHTRTLFFLSNCIITASASLLKQASGPFLAQGTPLEIPLLRPHRFSDQDKTTTKSPVAAISSSRSSTACKIFMLLCSCK